MIATRLKMPKQWYDGSRNGMWGGDDDGWCWYDEGEMMNLWENEF